MTRTHVNFVIDASAFAAFLMLASTGVLLRFQLPPGSGGAQGRGTGLGEAQQSVLTLWNWTRHDWGAIHFWIACTLMAVLVVHLFLHWRWVVCVVRGKATDQSGWRLGLGAVGMAVLILFAAAPWLSPTVTQTRSQLQDGAEISLPANGNSESPGTFDERKEPSNGKTGSGNLSEQIRGSMSLQETALLVGVPVDYLVEQLGLPANASPDARVGPLLRAEGMHMSDLRQAVDQAVVPNREAVQDREAPR